MKESITFDADFENGCLDRVVPLGKDWYHIALRPDTWYWFHFRIRGCCGHEIIFQFTCREIHSPGYQEGKGRWWFPPDTLIKPVVSYDGRNWQPVDRMEKDRSLFGTYRFTHTFSENEAFLCYSHPYTYTDMMRWVEQVLKNPAVTMEFLGKSRNGTPQPVLTITENRDSKNLVVIIAREDADEVTASMGLEGLVQQLLAKESKELVRRFVFRIVPMVCIDGVVAGGTHSAGYGYGGNRWHEDPSPVEIENVKTAVRNWVEKGSHLTLAGKLHGGQCLLPTREMSLSHHDILTSDQVLRKTLVQCSDHYWNPDGRDLTIRPKGFFERFLLDEFSFRSSFGTHLQGTTPDAVRNCGAGLMRAIAAYLNCGIR